MIADITPILRVNNLSVSFKSSENGDIKAVKNISYELYKGQILAIVGESGSGKSASALSILKLLPYPAAYHPSGEIIFEGDDLLQRKSRALRSIRGNKIAMIFQEPMSSLNPLHTVFKQISEAIELHQSLGKTALRKKIFELLEMVELDELKERLDAYPHELSGGQRQRVMIAMALANSPDILIADEPTTALDVTIQAQILALLKGLQKKLNMSIILITHDLTVVKKIADRVCVMRQGEIVENCDVDALFKKPQHEYSKYLLSSAPKGRAIAANEGAEILVSCSDLKVSFPVRKNFFGKVLQEIKAVDNVTISIKRGHTLGIIGESGSGKSTLALALLRLIKSEGEIAYNGRNINGLRGSQLRGLRQKIQMVFQDPFSSLNPRMSVRQIISEGLIAHNIGKDKAGREIMINQVLEDVGLELDIKNRYPHEFSGGQRQRINIARSLILKPDFMILDEPSSALDLSTQAEILEVLKKLQKKHNLTYMFISHDLRVIKSICHDVVVMNAGEVVEAGICEQIFAKPKSDYTKSLIEAAYC